MYSICFVMLRFSLSASFFTFSYKLSDSLMDVGFIEITSISFALLYGIRFFSSNAKRIILTTYEYLCYYLFVVNNNFNDCKNILEVRPYEIHF